MYFTRVAIIYFLGKTKYKICVKYILVKRGFIQHTMRLTRRFRCKMYHKSSRGKLDETLDFYKAPLAESYEVNLRGSELENT